MVRCSLSGILWQMELIEGMDSPSEIIPEYNNQGETVGLLLCVLEPIFARGNVVILDSGFCMLKGIVEFKKCGVYASALIEKWMYWPKYIKGNAIRDHFNKKNVGDCDSWKLISVVARRQLMSGWMGVETAKKTNSIILKWLETTSCTDTPSTTTTINDTHLLVWRLFGQQSIGQTKS